MTDFFGFETNNEDKLNSITKHKELVEYEVYVKDRNIKYIKLNEKYLSKLLELGPWRPGYSNVENILEAFSRIIPSIDGSQSTNAIHYNQRVEIYRNSYGCGLDSFNFAEQTLLNIENSIRNTFMPFLEKTFPEEKFTFTIKNSEFKIKWIQEN